MFDTLDERPTLDDGQLELNIPLPLRPIYIIGGGPSLIGFDWSRLRRKHCIAVNAAYKDVPWATHLVFSDGRFWEWNRFEPEWCAYRGEKVTTWRKAPEGITRYECAMSREPLAFNKRVLAGSCSGEKALNLAVHLGAREIYLLGFDMQANGNYHLRHKLGNRQAHYGSKFVPSLSAMGRAVMALGIKVINACPHSAVTVFPRISLDDLPC